MSAVLLVRLLLLIVSFYGYIQYFQKKIHIDLTIGFVFSAIGSLLFFAGILNILPEMAVVIWVGGFFLAVRSVWQKESIQNVLSGGTIFFLIAAVFFFFLLKDAKFVHYDNFSHWAVAPRILIESDRFPNFSDNIMFTSYPLGSAAFIYYMSKISGITAEWFQMYAQALLMAGLAGTLFVFSKGLISACLTGLCAVALLCGNTGFVDLLVDTLLPLAGISGMIFVAFYREKLREKAIYLLPYLAFLVAIKNSGALFALFIVCYAIIHLKDKVNYRTWILLAATPLATVFLWQKHADQVFANGMESKHSMSLSNFSTMFNRKSADDIMEIVGKLKDQALSLSNVGILLILLAAGIWLVSRLVLKQRNKAVGEMAISVVLSYIIYYVGMVGMYLFSMPPGEAMTLAGFGRYHDTIFVFMGGLLFAEILLCFYDRSETKFSLCKTGSITAVALALIILLSPAFSHLEKQDLSGTVREHYERIIEENHLLPNRRYSIVTGEEPNDAGYLLFLTKYLLSPKAFVIVPDEDIATTDWRYYDNVILFNQTPRTKELLAQYYTGNYYE